MVETFREPWIPCYDSVPYGCPVKPPTQEAMKDLVVYLPDHDIIQRVVLAVDGGHSEKDVHRTNSTWGIAVLFELDGDRVHLHECLGGGCSIDIKSRTYIGLNKESAFAAETYAQVMARCYILQTKIPCTRFHIQYDCTSANACGLSMANITGGDITQDFIHSLNKLVRAEVSLTTEHIKGHSGHPWNELADSLCSFFYKEPSTFWGCLFFPLSQGCVDDLSIATSVLCSDYVAQSIDGSDYNLHTQVALDHRIMAQVIDGDLDCGDGPKAQQECHDCPPVIARVVQYNVDHAMPKERVAIATMLKQGGIAFGLFQECSGKKTRVFEVEDYVVVAAAALKGHHGCEAWVAKIIRCRNRSIPIKIAKDDVSFIFGQPRIVIALLKHKFLACYLVSAHAPYHGCKQMCPPVWWEEFATAIQSHCVAGTPIIIGIDGNTRCFSDSSGAVGDLVSKKKEANACFGAMVKSISCDGHSNAFKVVNTFSCNCAPS